MEEGWEDALDVDDSDLPYLNPLPSLPTLQPCSQLSLPSQPLSSNPLREQRPSAPPLAEEEEAAAGETAAPPPRRIPGPAGAVQAAMHRQAAAPVAAAAAAVQCRGVSWLEGGGNDVGPFEDGAEEVDDDFSQNPWLCALDFLGRESIYIRGMMALFRLNFSCLPSKRWHSAGGSGNTSSISSIKALGSTGRVPKLIGIVKSCKPNGLGALFVTLKDPTGSIGASIHGRVLIERNLGGDLSVGCVLILKQVAVFSPMRSTVYLNVTLNNVDKLFSKDSGPPSRHVRPTLTAQCPASEPVGRAHFLRPGSQRIAAVESQIGVLVGSRTADIGNMEKRECLQASDREVVKSMHSKRTMDDRQVEHLSGLSMGTEEAAFKSVGFGDALRASLVRQGPGNICEEGIIHNSKFKRRIDNGTTETSSEELRNRMNIIVAATSLPRGMPVSPSNQEADHMAAEPVGSSRNIDMDYGEDERTGSLLSKASYTSASNSMPGKPPDKVAAQPKRMIPKVSVAQWTDEQLSELFCDYKDDDDLF